MSENEEKTLENLKKEVEDFIRERNWEKYHTPKNIAESISIEASELLEEFQWKSPEEIEKLLKDPKKKKSIEEEVADVMIYCLSLANRIDIDVSTAILDKLESNRQKYPKEEFDGEFYKPD